MNDPRQRRAPLTIAVVQPECVAYDVGTNAAAHAAMIRSAGTRVVVFPELSLTGYELDAPAIAADDPRLAPVVEACAEVGAMALAGAPVGGDDGSVHIGMLAVDGKGATIVYRKMWLGGSEPDRFSPGTAPAVLQVDGWRLGLAICKDTGVPAHASETAALGIDAYVAGSWSRRRTPLSWTSAPAAPPVITTSGLRSPASPARRAVATTRLPATPASGRPTARSWPKRGPRAAPSSERRSHRDDDFASASGTSLSGRAWSPGSGSAHRLSMTGLDLILDGLEQIRASA